jgi:hypothetical protein
MLEVKWLAEQAPLNAFKKDKDVQKTLFVAKLTSNDKKMDESLAERTAKYIA